MLEETNVHNFAPLHSLPVSGGHAKTLMFVQHNPDVDSFTESLSTLNFAERVSSVELGAAKSGKDGREFMEQVASLKDTIAKKDEEIERLNEKRGAERSPQSSPVPDEAKLPEKV